MEWSLSDPRVWAAIVIVLQAVAIVANYLGRKEFATRADWNKLVEIGADAHRRLDLLEQRVDQLPTHDTLAGIHSEIAELKQGQVEGRARLEGIGREVGMVHGSITRLDDFLRATR